MLTGREAAALATKACGVPLGQVIDLRRGGSDVSRARAAAAWVLRERWHVDKTAWGTIAALLKLTDAAAAIYAYRRAVRLIEADPVFAAACEKALERARRP